MWYEVWLTLPLYFFFPGGNPVFCVWGGGGGGGGGVKGCPVCH